METHSDRVLFLEQIIDVIQILKINITCVHTLKIPDPLVLQNALNKMFESTIDHSKLQPKNMN